MAAEFYHLSTKKFSSFKQQSKSGGRATDAGFHFGTKETAMSRATQIIYGGEHGYKEGQPLYLYTVKLNISKPLYLKENRLGSWSVSNILIAIFEQYESSGVAGVTDDMFEQWYEDVWLVNGDNAKEDLSANVHNDVKALSTWLKEIGYDSISYDNEYEGGGLSYIVLDPSLIEITKVEEISSDDVDKIKYRNVEAVLADTNGGPGYGLQQNSPYQSGSDMQAREDSLPAGAPMAIHEMNQHAPKIKEALLIRPYYLDMKTQKFNPQYPTLARVMETDAYPLVQKLLAAEGDEEPLELEMIETDPAEGEPAMEVAPEGEGEGDQEAEKAAGLAKLGIEAPEDFATKYKGQIQELAEEHGIGDPIAYSFRSRKIELIGSDAILLLDYDMNALHTRPMYPVEEGMVEEPAEEEAEESEGEEEESEETSEEE